MQTAVEVELSRFAAELAWHDLPRRVQDRVTDIWVDAVANALVGRAADNSAAAERASTRVSGPGASTVIGGGSTTMTAATFVNGYQITAFTMCDVYRPALCHVTPEVVPAVLALAEEHDVAGTVLLTALAIGLEITTRLGLGVDYPRFRARGWHAPGVIGTVGAAAAAARVLSVDDRQIRQAIGLGASQASGTFSALGTPAVKFHQARGAVSALWAAVFAAEGLGGSERALTHPDGGLFSAYGAGGRPDLVLERLGDHWELEQISLRRWPAASSLQSMVGCLLSMDANPPGLTDVDSVDVALPPASYDMCAEMGWDDELSAMQSARYIAAVVLRDGRCWVDQFARGCRVDPVLTEFARNRVTVRRDQSLPHAGAEVRVRHYGSETVLRRETAPGEPGDSLTRADITDKLTAAIGGRAVTARVDALKAMLVGTAELQAVAELCAGLRAAPARRTQEDDREFAPKP